jgi:sporulation protein YtfJ
MSEHVEKVLTNAIDGLKKMIDVDSVVGKPVQISENTTIIPVSKVSMGFVSGGAGFDKTKDTDNFGGGAGGGVKISPVAFLVITDGNVRLVSVSDSPDQLDKIFTKVPEVIDQISGLITKNKDTSPKAE